MKNIMDKKNCQEKKSPGLAWVWIGSKRQTKAFFKWHKITKGKDKGKYRITTIDNKAHTIPPQSESIIRWPE